MKPHSLFRRLEPIPLPIFIAIALPIVVGWHAASLAGVLWGLIPAAFTGLIPHLLNRWAARHHPAPSLDAGKPLVVVAGSAASLITGLIIVAAFPAPRAVVACAAGLFAILIAVGIASVWPRPDGCRGWNLSVHASSSAGAAVVCMAEFGVAIGTVAAVLAVAVAGARVGVYAATEGADGHTAAQAVAGTLVGAIMCGMIYTLLR
ncbi:hypothetical protein [Nonomuraea ceibae]|uniref:hypothetical protein n=1 Tax=Nonomuraea ceibae TaxID=1935170 RepID=UPI001C5D9AD9|nr:hypothetical protein [Nonomuraea ceibae]